MSTNDDGIQKTNILVGQTLNFQISDENNIQKNFFPNAQNLQKPLIQVQKQDNWQSIIQQQPINQKLTYYIEGHHYILANYILMNKDKAYELAQKCIQKQQQMFTIRNNHRVAEFSSSDGDEVIIQKKQRKIEKFKWTKQKQIKFQLICLLIGYDQICPKKIIQYMNDPLITNQVAGSHIQKFKQNLLKQEGLSNWKEIKNYQYLNQLETQKIKKVSRFWEKSKFQGFTEQQIQDFLKND